MLKPYQDPEAGYPPEGGTVDSHKVGEEGAASPKRLKHGPQAPRQESPGKQVASPRSRAQPPHCEAHSGLPEFGANADHSDRGGHAVFGRPPPPVLDTDGTPHYHVERLMARRHHQGKTQYLVKWKGYPHSQNSWESETPLRQDCRDVVDAFERENPAQHQRLKGRKMSPHSQ
ncbi:chromo domain-containing protein [Xanthomonas vasicola]|uniref:chromo domain-containing protein n=1 Tax=Xanthomonas vasicola TaxID=56459 RepID=UPI0034E086E6